MIENGANDWNRGMAGAAEAGNKDIVLLMIEKEPKHFSKWMCSEYPIGLAKKVGNMDILQLLTNAYKSTHSV